LPLLQNQLHLHRPLPLPLRLEADSTKNAQKGGKRKSKGKMNPEEKVKTPCVSYQMPSGCVHGDKCSYLHDSPKKANSGGTSSETKPKAKPDSKPAAKAKAMAVVALVAALSSMVSPVEGLLEFAADSGAARHLVSHEALAQQGGDASVIQPFLRPSHEFLRFHTGGGQRDSNLALGFQAHFVLSGCPFLQTIGQDVADGMSFVWKPGELPFFVKKGAKMFVDRDEGAKIYASRVHEFVPFSFKSLI